MRLEILVITFALGWPSLPAAQEDAGAKRGWEKFIVLGCQDGQASAWEYAPTSNELIKRYDFPGCRRTPRRLHKELPPTFLSVQVQDKQGIRSEERLLDYGRWTARKIEVERRFAVIGRIQKAYYILTRDGRQLRLNATTGEVTAVATPVWKVFELGQWWIIRTGGELMLFDPNNGRQVRGARVPVSHRSLPFRRGEHPAVSADGRYLAFMTGLNWERMQKGAHNGKLLPLLTNRLPSDVTVHDLDTGRNHTTPLGFFGVTASGKWGAKHSFDLQFLSEDRLTFLSVVEDATWSGGLRGAISRGEVERVTMRLPDGAVTRRRATPEDRPKPDPEREKDKKGVLGHLDRLQRVGSFLKRHAVVPEGKRSKPWVAAFSHDERRFLAWVPAAGFFHGDFESGKAKRVKADDLKGPRILFVRSGD